MKSQSYKIARLLLVIVVTGLFTRQRSAKLRFDKACKELGRIWDIDVNLDAIRFRFTSLSIKNIRLTFPAIRIQIFVEQVQIRFSILDFLLKRYPVSYLSIFKADVTIGRPSRSPAPCSGPNKPTTLKNFYKELKKVIDRVFHLVPEELTASQLNISVELKNSKTILFISSVSFKEKGYKIALSLQTLIPSQEFLLEGKIDKRARELTLEKLSGTSSRIQVFLGGTTLTVCYEKLQASAQFTFYKHNPYRIYCTLAANDLEFQNDHFADRRMKISNLAFDCWAEMDDKSFKILESSTGAFNAFTFSFYLEHLVVEENLFEIGFGFEDMNPKDILRSFPFFSYKELYELEASGNLSFIMQFLFKLDDPLHHLLTAECITSNLILKYPEHFKISQLHQAFTHQIYIENRVVHELQLHKGHPSFVSFDQLPLHLINTILCTEDKNFFEHKGIDRIFFGYAMALNLSKKKFVRGGSTLTMQVVRNLFLNHNKTIFRKIEEIILAWLLENYFNLSKERILEIYFNIIEFAPSIYGIKQASSFYFSKSPQDLTLTEALLFSYMIPRPKHFFNALINQSPLLKKNLSKHLIYYANVLIEKKYISKETFEEILPETELSSYLNNLLLSIQNRYPELMISI